MKAQQESSKKNSAVTQRIAELTRPTGVEDVMRLDLPARPRIAIRPMHIAAVAGFVLLVVAGVVLRSGPPPELVTPAPVAVPTSESTAPTAVVVAVTGDVDAAGLHTLEPNARVADALAAASNGVIDYSDPKYAGLNLAERLADGAHIRVPAEQAAPQPAAGGKLNLNTATAEELTTLRGVGPSTADAILTHREQVGGFSSVEQLMDVPGIGPAKFAALKDGVTV